MPNHNGVQYRTHGQAYRASQQDTSSKDSTSNAAGGAEVGDAKGKNIVAIKHNGGPPYQVKHEDGSVSKHDSHEELMSHLQQHIPGGMDEDMGEDQSGAANEDFSDGSTEAVNSLMG